MKPHAMQVFGVGLLPATQACVFIPQTTVKQMKAGIANKKLI